MSRLLIAALAFTALAAHGQVYKQLDASGRPRYTDSEPSPAGGRVEMVSPGRPAGESRPGSDWEEKEREFRRRQVDRNATARIQDGQRQKRCAEARERLVRLRSLEGVRLYRTDPAGGRSYYSDDEREAMGAETRKAVDDNC